MFTGIIEAVGRVRFVRNQAAARRLGIAANDFWTSLAPGASVAVDGVCLTVVRQESDVAEFDVVAETLARSTLGRRAPGDAVNLERSLAAGSRLDGHFVQGHVDAVGTISRIEKGGADVRYFFDADAACHALLVPKGSVAVDGISLTIAGTDTRGFSVALIPATLERTTLGRKRVGESVNIETDILARTVLHALESFRESRGAGPDRSASRDSS